MPKLNVENCTKQKPLYSIQIGFPHQYLYAHSTNHTFSGNPFPNSLNIMNTQLNNICLNSRFFIFLYVILIYSETTSALTKCFVTTINIVTHFASRVFNRTMCLQLTGCPFPRVRKLWSIFNNTYCVPLSYQIHKSNACYYMICNCVQYNLTNSIMDHLWNCCILIYNYCLTYVIYIFMNLNIISWS